MKHAVVVAANEFQKDETRRMKRGQARRMQGGAVLQLVGAGIALDSTKSEAGIDAPNLRNGRGSLAVEIFGYSDTFDEQAATVITDILHAVAARGYSPQAVLNQAAAYYAEESPL